MHEPTVAGARIETFDDAGALAFFLAAMVRPPAPVIVVVLDADGCTTGSVLVTDDDAAVLPLLELAGHVGPLHALVISDRDAGSACDADDVLEWEEAAGVVAAAGGRLVDWIVMEGDLAVSKARFAPTPGLAGPPPW